MNENNRKTRFALRTARSILWTEIMAPLYQNGWEKMMKYYRLTDESPAYTAAIVLHPGYKWQYIQDTWEPEWLPKAEVDTPNP
jgi:hypothetical protein